MIPIRHAAGRFAPALALATVVAIVGGAQTSGPARALAAAKRSPERRLEEPMRAPRAGDRERRALDRIPMRFAENRGQAPAGVAFVGHGADSRALAGPDGARVAIGSAEVALRTARAARVEGVERVTSTSNYLVGDDPSRWRTNVPNFAAVRLESAAPGADLTLSGEANRVTIDLTLAAGSGEALLSTDAERVRVEPTGGALLSTPGGALRLSAPVAFVEEGGVRRAVPATFEAAEAGSVRVVAAGARRSPAATVRVTSVLSADAAGVPSDEDEGWDVAFDAAGNAYVGGSTKSTLFPVAAPVQPALRGETDGFVAKFDPAGRLVFSTFLGGRSGDGVHAVAADGAGNVYVTGSTASPDFPVAYALQLTNHSGCDFLNGCYDAFVAKLNPGGTGFVWSTYLGGENDEDGNAIRVDSAGNVYVVGSTNSTSFPTINALQPEWGGGFCGPFACPDAFVAKYYPDGLGQYFATYLGGFGYETGEDVAIDASGAVYVAGVVASENFPLASPVQDHLGGETDAFATKLAPSGTSFVYSTYLGGTSFDSARGVAADAAGNAYVVGTSYSLDYPATSPLQTGNGGAYTTTNGAASWTKVNAGLLATAGVGHVAVDASVATTAYMGSRLGVFKTVDGGASWTAANNGLSDLGVQALAASRSNPAVLYVATGAGVYKTSDGAASWSPAQTGLPDGNYVPVLEVDPTNPAVAYAYSPAEGIFKTSDGGASWSPAMGGLAFSPLVFDFDVDPTAPSTVYAAAYGKVLKSTDAGGAWVELTAGLPSGSIYGIAVAPNAPSTLYAATLSSGIFKSVDAGETWFVVSTQPEISGIITSIAADPSGALYVGMEGDRIFHVGFKAADRAASAFAAPEPASRAASARDAATAAAGVPSVNGGVFKSTDGGASWTPVVSGLTSNAVEDVAVAPSNPSRLYAATSVLGDAVLTKLGPTGSVVASTYFGGEDEERGVDVALDQSGNVYLAGVTWSLGLPTAGAVQPANAAVFHADGFVAKLASPSGALLTSTYLGGEDDEFPAAIAVDANGGAAVTGLTYSTHYPVVSAHQAVFGGGGFDAMVTRLAPGLGSFAFSTYLGGFSDTPVVTEVLWADGRIVVKGNFFDVGATVLLDNSRQFTRNAPDNPTTTLIVPRPSLRILPGTTVRVVVRNASGKTSAPFLWTRPTS